MPPFRFLLAVGVLLVSRLCSGAHDPRPNVVLILADDLGYGDLSCYGATKVTTPSIDGLARQGIRLTDAHTPAGVCCPTRYGVMTGRYPWRRGQPTWATPAAGSLLDPKTPTLAQVLRPVGYRSGCVGKWHLGMGSREQPVNFNEEVRNGPLDFGFDYCFADPGNRFGLYVEDRFALGRDPANPFRVEGNRLKGGKKEDLVDNKENARVLTQRAVGFIERSAGQPFFLYFVPNNIHTPLTPNAKFKGKSLCGEYGDFTVELDWSVGEVLAALDRLKLADNTLVVFTSDNGGFHYASAVKAGHRCNGSLNGQKGDVWEGGNRVPFIARWPGRIQPGSQSPVLACLTDLMATFAAAANVALPMGAGRDSINLLPVLTGQASAGPRDTLVMQAHFDPVRLQGKSNDTWAIRQGKWKLVFGQGSGGRTTSQEASQKGLGLVELGLTNSDFSADGKLKPDAPKGQLYDLEADPGETRNVYQEHLDVVQRLAELFEKEKRP